MIFDNIERFSTNIPKNRVSQIRAWAQEVLLLRDQYEHSRDQQELSEAELKLIMMAGYIIELTEGA